MSIKYRADIDGLRAIAVLSVVFFHIDHQLLPGGFAGVDIFFVISGFLITGIISKGISDGSFSIAEFYRRRIKRIVPVLVLVVLTTLLVGNFLLLPDDFARLAQSAIASQVFAANIYFAYFLDTSYFAADASLEPLLHLWSLGVEEQFYLFWPFVLIGLTKLFGVHSRFAIILFLAISSFVLAQWLLPTSPMFAYYMLPSRAGQLLGGALCFLLVSNFQWTTFPKWFFETLALAGLFAIAYSLIFIDESSAFPGVNALPVTLGAMFVIFSGSLQNTVLSRVLSLKPIVSVGLVSYSMYLWHWPVLAYMRYVFTELDYAQMFTAFAVICVLSYTSYYAVEQYFKKSRKDFWQVFVAQFLAPVLATVAICSLVIWSEGYGTYWNNVDYREELRERTQEIQPGYKYPWICQSFAVSEPLIKDARCRINTVTEPNVLLWGDSNGSHYVGVLGEIAKMHGFSFRTIAHASCPSILDCPERFVRDELKTNCLKSNRVVRQHLSKYDTIILSSDWNSYLKVASDEFAEALASTVKQLKSEGKQVLLMGRVPIIPAFDRDCMLKQVKLSGLNCSDRFIGSRERTERVNRSIKRVAKEQGALYFDITDVLCSEQACSGIFEGSAVYHDPGHLSMEGSIGIGRYTSKDVDTLAVFKTMISGDQRYTGEGVLPWDLWKDGEGLLDRLGTQLVHDLGLAEEVQKPEAWLGTTPRAVPDSQGVRLQFEDSSTLGYGAAHIDLLPFSSAQVAVGDTLPTYYLLQMNLSSENGAASLVRIRPNSASKQVIDAVVLWDSLTVLQRGLKAGIYAKLEEEAGSLMLQILVPASYVKDQFKLEVYPAVSGKDGAYSKKHMGRIEIWNSSLFSLIET